VIVRVQLIASSGVSLRTRAVKLHDATGHAEPSAFALSLASATKLRESTTTIRLFHANWHHRLWSQIPAF
jgi:hypothetical protein